MTAHNGNTEQDERGLLPYPVIIAATKGDPEAMKIVVQHYEMILSILVDTFISKISFPMQPGPEIGSISDA